MSIIRHIRTWSPSFWVLYPPFAILAFGYMLLCGLQYENPVKSVEIKVLTKTVRPGEFLKINFVFERYRTCALTRRRFIIDGGHEWHEVDVDDLPGTGNPTKPGESEEITIRAKVGSDFAPGPSAYRAILSYSCPIHLGPLTLPNLFQIWSPKVMIPPDIPFVIAGAKTR